MSTVNSTSAESCFETPSGEEQLRGMGPTPCADPITELLASELREQLPHSWHDRLESVPARETIGTWLALGAALQLSGQPDAMRVVEDNERSHDPAQLLRRLLQDYAARAAPPRSRRWQWLDRLGLLMSFLFAAAIVTMRPWILSILLPPEGPGSSLLMRPLCALGVTVWFAIEAAGGPRMMEILRPLPQRLAGLPPPFPTRTDAFYVLWILQAFALQLLYLANSIVLTTQVFEVAGISLWQRVPALIVWSTSAGVVAWTIRKALSAPGISLRRGHTDRIEGISP